MALKCTSISPTKMNETKRRRFFEVVTWRAGAGAAPLGGGSAGREDVGIAGGSL